MSEIGRLIRLLGESLTYCAEGKAYNAGPGSDIHIQDMLYTSETVSRPTKKMEILKL